MRIGSEVRVGNCSGPAASAPLVGDDLPFGAISSEVPLPIDKDASLVRFPTIEDVDTVVKGSASLEAGPLEYE